MIYLDNAATTQPFAQVVEKMLPFYYEGYGNPGSLHTIGRKAAKAVDEAREQVAALIGASPDHIIFTAGGSEANNLAILGLRKYLSGSDGKPNVVISATEHESVITAAHALAGTVPGGSITTVLPAKDGTISVSNVEQCIGEQTGLVSVMCVNNETGATNPVEDIATVCMKRGVLFHTDCVQAAGCIKLDVQNIGCDFLSISSHKLHGPKGIGALYVKDKSLLQPLIWGGEFQEYGLRGGTENVPGIVGFGEACRLFHASEGNYAAHTEMVKQGFYAKLKEALGDDGFTLNGQSVIKPGKILSLTFDGVDAQTLVLMLDAKGIFVSTGSACNSHSMTPSHVLKSMGFSDEQANSTIRVSFSVLSDLTKAEKAAELLADCVTALRSIGRSCNG